MLCGAYSRGFTIAKDIEDDLGINLLIANFITSNMILLSFIFRVASLANWCLIDFLLNSVSLDILSYLDDFVV